MSARLTGLVIEHYPEGGSEFTLAIVLADESTHSGGILATPPSELARLSRQSEKNVRRLLAKMEASGWLQCIERSKGGFCRPSRYQINQEWVRLPIGFEFGQQHGQNVHVLPGNNLDKLSLFQAQQPGQIVHVVPDAPFLLNHYPPISPQNSGSAVPSATAMDDTDLKLARWIHGLLLSLNPKQRPPPWKRWCRDIRVMTNAGHSHKDIALLFKYANDDRNPRPGSEFCWARVILSPGKLWRQWDQLTIQRAAESGSKTVAADNPLCSRCHVKSWTRQQGKGGVKLCGACADALEAAA